MIITQKRLPLKYFSWFLSCLQLGFCFCVFGVLLLGCFPLLWKGSCAHPLLLSSVDIKAFLCSCVFFFFPSTRNKALDLVSCNVPPLSLCDALVLLLQLKDSIASSSGLHVVGFLNANATSKSPDLLSV